MDDRGFFRLRLQLPVQARCAGLFVSRGKGIHPTLKINTHELLFVRSGVLGMFEGDRRFTVRAGEALLIRPGRKHGGTVPYSANLSFYWLHFHAVSSRRSPGNGTSDVLLPQHARVNRPDRLIEFWRRFLDDRASGRATPLSGSLLVALILEEVAATNQRSDSTLAIGAETLVARAEEFVTTHFHQPISAGDVADHLDCNPDYLGRVFRQRRKLTLTEFINNIRLQHARQLLMDRANSIDSVAREVGFNEAGYFCRLFRQSEGQTPSAFRRSYARMHINTE